MVLLTVNSYRSPVIHVGLLVTVIIHVVVASPSIVIDIQVVGFKIVSHVEVSVHVFQLGVVVVWDRREWIEEIWINGLGWSHGLPLRLIGGFVVPLLPGHHNLVDKEEESWVDHQVSAPAHTAN